ncbi:hypothetical protein JAAARDRAFT_212044 [Jaapia argillacea MUCL 33604]|uniref:BTB domain-containing protein n=1 Tax=Jaapia argillacea MUCL 33604 TaxID=933084 RepID=A0A067P7D7_9AGAM|nr:hypothetical protein JAAARDRAFT_212044 [Jaapia argillacea MUCL 33604]
MTEEGPSAFLLSLCPTPEVYYRAKIILLALAEGGAGDVPALTVGESDVAAICAFIASNEIGSGEPESTAGDSFKGASIRQDQLDAILSKLESISSRNAANWTFAPSYQTLPVKWKVSEQTIVVGWMEAAERVLLSSRKFLLLTEADGSLMKCSVFYWVTQILGRIKRDKLVSKYGLSCHSFSRLVQIIEGNFAELETTIDAKIAEMLFVKKAKAALCTPSSGVSSARAPASAESSQSEISSSEVPLIPSRSSKKSTKKKVTPPNSAAHAQLVSSEPRPAKRPRIDQEEHGATLACQEPELVLSQRGSPPPESGCLKSQDLWFDDGSVILKAQHTLFRVHCSILSSRSSLLAELVAGNVGASSPESSAIELSDSSRDLENFLKALYDPFTLYRATSVVYPDIFGVFRLSAKYGVSKLRKVTFDLLGLDALTSLESVVTLADEDITPERAWWIIQAISLSRESESLELLPGALYLCCGLSIGYILNGVVLDGINATLSDADKALCFLGRETLLDIQQTKTWSCLYNPRVADSCSAEKQCSHKIAASLLQTFAKQPLGRPRVFSSYGRWDELVRKQVCCKECAAALKAEQGAAVGAAWAALPIHFGLGTWDDLRAARPGEQEPQA